jgi:drug/metabolite transporter (DMT)-like permease
MPYILLIFVILFWSGNFIVARAILPFTNPIWLSFWRWAIALLLILPFSVKSCLRQHQLIRTHWRILALLALLGITSFSTFIYLALQNNTVTNTVLVYSINPIIIVIISWIGFRDRITWSQSLGIALSLSGLVWIITRGNPEVLFELQLSVSDLWTLVAAASWALYTALLRRYPQNINPLTFLTVIIMLGLIFLFPLYVWENRTQSSVALNFSNVSGTMYLAIFPSLLAYIFWNKAVNIVGANKAGVFIYLNPVFSIILAFLIFGERFQTYHPMGMALIFLGIFLTAYRRGVRRSAM